MDLKTPLRSLGATFKFNAKRLSRLEIESVQDLLFYTPFRYENSSIVSKIGVLQAGETVTIKGRVVNTTNIYTKKHLSIQKLTVEDETGKIDCIFFNQPYILKGIKKGDFLSAAGKADKFGRKTTLAVRGYEVLPDELADTFHTGRLVPIYFETRGLTSKWIRNRIKNLLSKDLEIKEYLPQEIIRKRRLIGISDAIKNIHFPKSIKDAEAARARLAFDELFLKHTASLIRKKEWESEEIAVPFDIDSNRNKIDELIKNLPFELTTSQKKAIAEICEDLKKETPMNRLLEGDVGSGKTIVAAIAMYLAYLNGFQSAMMAPTEILAQQHFETITSILEPFRVKVELFTSSTKNHKSSIINHQSFDIAIGTHALIHGKVKFERLGLVVIDEQQRFGVEQRAIIREKGKNPHLLTMTATPIPRTIFLTIYADLALSILSEMPKGRKKIKTWLIPEEKRENGYRWIQEKVKKEKSQVFIVCPFIEPSETLNTVAAAKEEFDRLRKDVFPGLKLGLLHGKMKAGEKDKVIKDFREEKINVLVATPVIEVGIDIPTADIIVIEAAERFGLAQLHQLRGRVGRGEKESFCLLFSGSNSEKTRERLTLLQTLNEGAKLAEADLKLRGPGEMFGTMQHGIPELKIASFSDFAIISASRKEAENVFWDLDKYPQLKKKIEETVIQKISKD